MRISFVRKSIICFLICWAVISSLQAQDDVVVRSGFLNDSLAIGDVTGFYLTARYPSRLNILFPDSAYNFSPFEYERKNYFPTDTRDGKSYDSVVYYLSTFEVDKLQFLTLPVYQLNATDSMTYASPRDTIRLIELVTNIPDSVTLQNIPFKINTAYQEVPYLFNYPILFIVLGVLVVMLVIVWILFGKRIRKYYRLKRMQNTHQKFIESYSTLVDNIGQAFSTANTEHALVQWKKYMEQLESRPYTKLTTRETTRLENNEALGKNLHTIDGAIYGHSTSVLEPLEHLKTFAQQRFVKKVEEVKHG